MGNRVNNLVLNDQNEWVPLRKLTPPEETPYQDYFLGADDTFFTLTTTVEKECSVLDISKISPAARSIAVICEGIPSYNYEVHFNRSNDYGESRIVKSGTGIVVQNNELVIPDGYDLFVGFKITATGTGTQLNFKIILNGRGAA